MPFGEALDSYNLSTIFADDGRRLVHATVKDTDKTGKIECWLVRDSAIRAVSQLRIDRRANVLYFWYARRGSSVSQLQAQQSVSTDRVPMSGIRLVVHTGGAGRETEVFWKTLAIHANEILNPPQQRR